MPLNASSSTGAGDNGTNAISPQDASIDGICHSPSSSSQQHHNQFGQRPGLRRCTLVQDTLKQEVGFVLSEYKHELLTI
jgi:hypothetical protein